jgi:polyhydroxybutyrate depolymerase
MEEDFIYLGKVIDGVKRHFNVDPKRVYVVGHSNGGIMAYSMACHHSGTIAAVASLAGPVNLDPDNPGHPVECPPASPVNVLHIAGTDDSPLYQGGCFGAGELHPNVPANFACTLGAEATVKLWASFDGCSIAAEEDPQHIDLDGNLAGEETVVSRYRQDCQPGGAVELWRIRGADHYPNFSREGETTRFGRLLVEWFLSHPKP